MTGRPVLLEGIDLVVFDKDGTLIGFGTMWSDWAIELGTRLSDAVGRDIRGPDGTLIGFGTMWSDWAIELGTRLSDAVGRDIRGPLDAMLGFDPVTGAVSPHGGLAATPMARLREMTQTVLTADGIPAPTAERALAAAWHAPDPEARVQPLADLRRLLAAIRGTGRRVAIATSDDREPTERTIAALGLVDLVDATVCADDGVPVKPAPDMVLRVCDACGVPPSRAAVVGDSPADLRMGRSAGAGLVVGVLTGVGGEADLKPLADRVIGSVEQLRVS